MWSLRIASRVDGVNGSVVDDPMSSKYMLNDGSIEYHDQGLMPLGSNAVGFSRDSGAVQYL